MTRENAKDIAEAISFKIQERQRLSLPGVNEVIDQIYNDHEEQLKAKDKEIERLNADIECAKNMMKGLVDGVIITHKVAISKARSIVAMLFWRAKKDKRLADEENKYFTYNMALHSFILFKQAYKMLKDNK